MYTHPLHVQALVHQHNKLKRFTVLPGFPPDSQHYVRRRIAELAQVRQLEWSL